MASPRIWAIFRDETTSPHKLIKDSWHDLRIGMSYVVVAYKEVSEQIGPLSANVMQFMGYDLLSEEWQAQYKQHMGFQIEHATDRIANLKDSWYNDDSDDDLDEEDFFADVETAKDELRYLKRMSKAGYYSLKFQELSGERKIHTIDPFSLAQPCLDLKIEVMNIASTDWFLKLVEPNGMSYSEMTALLDKAKARMTGIHQQWAGHIIQEVAAMRIQRAWRRAQANPKYSLCRKRLRNECEEMKSNVELQAKRMCEYK